MSTAHLALKAQLSPSGGHRGPSEGGQTWPQIAQLPRSVFTGWTVKFGLGIERGQMMFAIPMPPTMLVVCHVIK